MSGVSRLDSFKDSVVYRHVSLPVEIVFAKGGHRTIQNCTFFLPVLYVFTALKLFYSFTFLGSAIAT